MIENMGFQQMTWSYVSPQYKYLMHFSCNFTGPYTFINFSTMFYNFKWSTNLDCNVGDVEDYYFPLILGPVPVDL